MLYHTLFFFFSSRRRHTRFDCDWSSDVCSSDLAAEQAVLDKIKSNPNSGQYSSQIDQAQTKLTNAQNILNAVGTNIYQGTQQTDVWNALHDAHGIIKQLWSELNGHGQKSTSSSSSGSSGSYGK